MIYSVMYVNVVVWLSGGASLAAIVSAIVAVLEYRRAGRFSRRRSRRR